MKNPIGLTFAITALALSLSGCDKPPSTKEKAILNVDVVEIGDDSMGSELHFPAIAAAADRAELSFLVAGEINKINVNAGDIVEKDTVLATLDPTEYKLQVDNAQAKFDVVDSQYRRSKPLVDKGLLAKSQFDEIGAQRAIAKAELELAKLKLSYTELKAPVNGVISRVPVEQFETVGIGQSILNIHDATQVDIRIQVPDVLFSKHGGKTREENNATISPHVRTDDGKAYPASVKEYTAQPDPETGSFMVTLTMPMPEDKFILDGMTVEVVVEELGLYNDRASQIEIPIETVFNEDGDALASPNKFVWVVGADNTVEKRKVNVGELTPKGVLVTSGLKRGDKVVSEGVNRLRAGQSVNIVAKKEIN